MRVDPHGLPLTTRGPPGKPPDRKPLLAEPVTLAVIHQALERPPAAAAENDQRSGEWIGGQDLATQARQSIDALAVIPSSE